MEARANHISLCTYIIISESEKLTKKLRVKKHCPGRQRRLTKWDRSKERKGSGYG